MPKVTRRGFIAQTSASVATIGMLATVPALAMESEAPATASVATSGVAPAIAAMTEPLVAHVSDFASGEISLLVGTQEIVYRDPELVQRLLRAIQ